jgi:hypothetical protein
MAAITGCWTPPNKGINGWAIDWLHGSHRWSSPRKHLATQIRYIKLNHGRTAASEFRNYLLWLGSYPTKRV